MNKRVTPNCCEAVQTHRTVFLSYSNQINRDGANPPTWMARKPITEDYQEVCPVSYCPHCGQPLPELERNHRVKKVCIISDGGYYCDTCKGRLNECSCLPTVFLWKPKRQGEP